jgi:hypothetical protein
LTNVSARRGRCKIAPQLPHQSDHARWICAPLAVRIIGRRYGLASASISAIICEAAGIGSREDRR